MIMVCSSDEKRGINRNETKENTEAQKNIIVAEKKVCTCNINDDLEHDEVRPFFLTKKLHSHQLLPVVLLYNKNRWVIFLFTGGVAEEA